MNRAESPTPMGAKTSFSIWMFEQVLRAFGTGDITYAVVLAQLQRLLATGASPTELLEILRRCELSEPLPESAQGLFELLNDAIRRDAAEAAVSAEARDADPQAVTPDEKVLEERTAPQPSDYEALTRSYERTREAESAASTRAAALAAELAAAKAALAAEQRRTRDLDVALAEKNAVAEASRTRVDEILRDYERHKSEMRTLRDWIAARDATIVQVRHSLDERDTQLAALQQEHAKLVPALEARADGISLELKVGQEAAAVLTAQLERSESSLNAALTELGAVKTQTIAYLELLRTREWRRGFDQNMFHELTVRVDVAELARGALQAERDHLYAQVESLQRKLEIQDALVDKAQSAANADSKRAAELHAAAQRRESEQAAQVAAVESARAARIAQLVPDAETREQESTALIEDSEFVAEFSAPERGEASKPRAIAPAMALSAAVFVLAVVAWFFAHRAPVPTQVPAASSPAVPKPGTVIRDCPTCPAMTILPAGRFTQGSARVESVSASFEKPLHWVLIRRPFAMSTNVVTVDDFQQFIAATGRDMQGCDTYDGEWKHQPENSWRNPGFMQTGTHPVTCASWNDAEAYAQWLSTKTGHRYRLPSASEWEYAARAGGESVQPWSADGSGACANANVADESAAHEYPGWVVFGCDDGYVHTAPVGSFKANPFGLNDMLGNVFQWTEDCWHPDYTGAPIDGSARADGNCSEHELRGGSWFTTPAYVRANYRNHFAADYRTSSVGIRLVRDIEQ